MFTKKETPYYKKYFLFGKCVWKKQKSVKAVSDYLLNKISEMCTDIQKDTNKNIYELQTQMANLNTDTKTFVKNKLSALNDNFETLSDNVKKEFVDSDKNNSKKIKELSDELSKQIANVNKEISGSDKNNSEKIKKLSDELSKQIANVNKEISGSDKNNSEKIKKLSDELSKQIANVNKEISGSDKNNSEKIKKLSDELNKQIQSLSGAANEKFENLEKALILSNDKQSEIISNFKSSFDTVNNEYKNIINAHSELLKNMQSKIEWEINKIHFLNAVAIRKEVEYHGFTLNKDWEKSFVNYRIESYELLQIPVKDLFIDDWMDKNMGTAVKVTESPNYKYLCGDKSDYIKRCKNEPSHSCETFDALIKKLDDEGFDKSKIIVCQQDFHIVDGAHRASYLAYKYGPDYVVNVLKLVLV